MAASQNILLTHYVVKAGEEPGNETGSVYDYVIT